MRSSLPASSNCDDVDAADSDRAIRAHQIPAVASESVVRIDCGRPLELVPCIVGQHDVGQGADLGMTTTLEGRIEQLAVGVPRRGDRALRRSASASAYAWRC